MTAVLVLAAHPDDDVLGMGGTIRKHVVEGDRVRVAYLTSGELGCGQQAPEAVMLIREGEAKEACSVLGTDAGAFWHARDSGVSGAFPYLRSKLRHFLQDFPADLVYCPHPGDGHVDHQGAARLALEWTPPGTRILGYELWTPINQPSLIVDIGPYVDLKRAAIRCHKSQVTRNSLCEGMLALNQYRGLLHGPNKLYAEAFVELR